MAVNEGARSYTHPLYETLINTPGLSVAVTSIDKLLTWGSKNSLWVFPMATSCCGIEFMAAAASRVDLDRMGTIVRATPRQSDVMVVAGTITVKMAPRVKALWDQMPEPKWCVAMGSCAISGDFYRNLYPVVQGIDTFLPVDVYIPGCPPNPEVVMAGLLKLQEKVELVRAGKYTPAETRPETEKLNRPKLGRLGDASRDPKLDDAQEYAAGHLVKDQYPDEPALVKLRALAAPALPAPAESSVKELLAKFGVTEFPADAPPLVDVARHVELARTLKAAGYTLFVHVVATHRPAKAGTDEKDSYELAYALRKPEKGAALAAWRVKVEAEVPSLVGVFAAADWQEREQFDLVGVRFAGHPDLRRIMLPEDWQGHPLRRDFPADAACAPWR